MNTASTSSGLKTVLSLTMVTLGCLPLQAGQPKPATPDAQMQRVLDKLATLRGKPIETLSAGEARKQPTPADAVMAVIKEKGKPAQEKTVKVEDIKIDLATGDVKARIYQPEGKGPFPVILYIHGGGWVIADLDTYDATPRALATATGALVISTHYRQAPEHPFPAAHEDCFGAYQWTLKNAQRWNGDSRKTAVVGESAGGNMAASLCLVAQEKGVPLPVHQVLVYPVADTAMNTPSYIENAKAKPLSAAVMKWFAEKVFTNAEDASDPRVALLKVKSFKGLPPATVITAQIDPLRSEGEALAQRFNADGVKVVYRNYEGVTHEFFGMAAVVDQAKAAQELVAAQLSVAFGKTEAVVK